SPGSPAGRAGPPRADRRAGIAAAGGQTAAGGGRPALRAGVRPMFCKHVSWLWKAPSWVPSTSSTGREGDGMCGGYASARKREELLAEFRIERDRVDESLEPDYNVAPTKPVYAVMTRGARGSGDAGPQDVARELRVVRWGLVPSWAKDI